MKKTYLKTLFLTIMMVFALVGCGDDGSEPNSNGEMVELITSTNVVDTCGCKGEILKEFTNRKMVLYIDTTTNIFDESVYLKYLDQNENKGFFYLYKNNRYFTEVPDVYELPYAFATFDEIRLYKICNFPIQKLLSILKDTSHVVETEFSGKEYYFSGELITTDVPPYRDLYLTSFKISKNILNGEK